ncbi:Frataxin [Pisolithus marmoratus]|nr:Frataxin [Pisolithus marmoratus]
MILRTLRQHTSRTGAIFARSVLVAPSSRLFSLASISSGGDVRHWWSKPCKRALTTPPPQTSASEFQIEEYHTLSDTTMTTLLERLEGLLDELADNDAEVDYHGGVLTLKLGSQGTYVINKQPPNKQIWLSSPISGPKRYDYVRATDDWRYSRDGEELSALLERELSETLGRDVRLGLGRVSNLA